MSTNDWIRAGGLLLAIIATIVYVRKSIRYGRKRLYYSVVLVWLAINISFYVMLLFFHHVFEPMQINTISHIIRYLAFITFIILAAF